MERVIELLKNGQVVPEILVSRICKLAEELLINENNILVIPTPVTVCGDVHGQLHDLFTLFATGGDCPSTRYLFLGDFVDRGFHSVETFLLLLCLKVRYPDRINLVRGNHESRTISQSYGFYDECLRKYGNTSVWSICCSVFDYLAIGAMIGGPHGIFCVHGGLSPVAKEIDDIRAIDRNQEVPHDGAMCDLLWSDPDDSLDSSLSDFVLSSRGAGFLFSKNAVEEFHHTNKTSLIARAHQLAVEGFKEMFERQLVTVWSAPNYCYRCGNLASIMEVDDDLNRTFKVFDAIERPGADLEPIRHPHPEYFL